MDKLLGPEVFVGNDFVYVASNRLGACFGIALDGKGSTFVGKGFTPNQQLYRESLFKNAPEGAEYVSSDGSLFMKNVEGVAYWYNGRNWVVDADEEELARFIKRNTSPAQPTGKTYEQGRIDMAREVLALIERRHPLDGLDEQTEFALLCERERLRFTLRDLYDLLGSKED